LAEMTRVVSLSEEISFDFLDRYFRPDNMMMFRLDLHDYANVIQHD
jgi:hypothetical protein